MTDDRALRRYGDKRVLALFDSVTQELLRRRITRSVNNPVADYAELLVANHFGVAPERGVQLGYDVKTKRGRRVQVKARRRSASSKPSHYGWIRNLEGAEFDQLALILFDAKFRVLSADLLTRRAVLELAGPLNQRVNGHRVPLIRPDMRRIRGVKTLNLEQPEGLKWPAPQGN